MANVWAHPADLTLLTHSLQPPSMDAETDVDASTPQESSHSVSKLGSYLAFSSYLYYVCAFCTFLSRALYEIVDPSNYFGEVCQLRTAVPERLVTAHLKKLNLNIEILNRHGGYICLV